jgi:tetratricopeptide (TPR) repeat protein
MKPWLLVARAAFVALTVAPGALVAHEGHAVTRHKLDARIAATPTDASALLDRASLARRTGRYADALRDLAALEKLDPSSRALRLERGLVRVAQRDFRRAKGDLDAFVGQGGKHPEAHRGRAAIARAAGQLELARAELDAAYRLRPTPDAALERGAVDEAAGRLDRAALGYREALADLSGAHTIRMALVRVEQARGDRRAALEALEPAIRDDGLAPSLLLLRADLRAGEGDSAAARRDREEALRRATDALARRATVLAATTRARALVALGRVEEAEPELDAIVARSPDQAEAREVLARVRGAGRRRSVRP